MCGFAGRLYVEPRPSEHLESIARRMNRCLRHRGPDAEGFWSQPAGHTVFAFSRLSIQDLSPEANQPMHSESRRYSLVYNGEIYNTDDLRRLIGRNAKSFRTHSDTELLLACIESLGLEQTLRAANGMFGIALWDHQRRMLSLARDRFGEKPLHYAISAEHVTFASEIKAILAGDDQSRALSSDAVSAYFALTYVPGTMCIFEGIRKLAPGSILQIDSTLHCTERKFWSLEEIVATRGDEKPMSFHAACEQTRFLLTDSVSRRLISDVPVGLLLSGGTDSSLIAFNVAKTLGHKLQTFTVGLEEESLDESHYAKAIAEKLGVENECLILSDERALATLDPMIATLDEPFADGSAASVFAICQLARKKVTVLLGGDGGDELFGGYTRYRYATGWRGAASSLYARLRIGVPFVSDREIATAIYLRLMTTGTENRRIARELLASIAPQSEAFSRCTVLQHLRYIDINSYLPDDILLKADRMSMASSLELRSPFLDHRLLEASWHWPDNFFLRGGSLKPILRALFSAAFGKEMLQSKKYGFHSPLADWLRRPLRTGMEEAIDHLKDSPHIPMAEEPTRKLWRQLLAGDNRPEAQLWNLYVFWRWSQRDTVRQNMRGEAPH